MVASPGGCLTSLRSLGRRGLQTAVMKLSMSWTSEQNSTHWGGSLWRICCRHKTNKCGCTTGVRGCVNSRPGDKVLVLLPTSSSKLLAKWQGPFVVTRRVGELDYEVKRTDRGDACQIYHLNLLKRWNEGTSVGLAAVVSNEDDLGPEAAL